MINYESVVRGGALVRRTLVLLPDEIQQSVGRTHDGLAAVLRVLFLGRTTRVDDGDHDDPHYHRHKGGPQVIRHCDQTEPTGALGVKSCQSWHQTGKGETQLDWDLTIHVAFHSLSSCVREIHMVAFPAAC